METNEERFGKPALPHGERPVRLGSLLFTIVDARAGFEVAYNRWYERDHFYSGCLVGEYTIGGNRYIATRDCKAKRIGSGERDLAKGSCLALYWIEDGHHDEWNAWAVKTVKRLHAEGRMFKERDHVHTGLYRYGAEFNAPGSAMPVELALDRFYGGLAAFIVELENGKTLEDVAAILKDADDPGDVALLASPLPLDATRPADVPTSEGHHVIFLSFSLEDPLDVWETRYVPLARKIDASGAGRISFASPFKSAIFGTDTYTDAL